MHLSPNHFGHQHTIPILENGHPSYKDQIKLSKPTFPVSAFSVSINFSPIFLSLVATVSLASFPFSDSLIFLLPRRRKTPLLLSLLQKETPLVPD